MLGKGFGAALSMSKFLTSNLINIIDLKEKDEGPKTKQKKKVETDEVVADENE